MNENFNFIEKVNNLKKTLSSEQQKMLSLHSVQIFLYAYNDLTKYKMEVKVLLENYFKEIEELNYKVDKSISTRLAFDYIRKIGVYYRVKFKF